VKASSNDRRMLSRIAGGSCFIKAQVDPRSVVLQYVRHTPWEKLRFASTGLTHPHLVQGGCWDLRAQPCDYHPTYQVLAELLQAELTPSATPLFHWFLQAARRGRPVRRRDRRLVDSAAIEEFFAEYIDLVVRIRAEGYQSGRGRDEPGVAIGRRGEVANGNHRFAIARLLGIAPIPVQVHYVHAAWYAATPRGSQRVERAVDRALSSSTAPAAVASA